MNVKEMFAKRFSGQSAKGDEFGFTNTYAEGSKRIINKDGTFNVRRIGEKRQIFHEMLTMSWAKFFLYIISFYAIVNLLFAGLYMLIDIDGIGMTSDYEVHRHFLISLFFSAQTLTTVGYGSLYPLSSVVSAVAASEALVGLMGFAIFTGLMYGRFSRPKPGIRFSHNALISPYREGHGLMFRVANELNNNLTELEVRGLMVIVIQENGKETRKYHNLKFDNNRITYFPMNWTIVHPIDAESPLSGMGYNDLKDGSVELVVMIKGFNETNGQEIHAKYSYTFDEIIWDAKFRLPYFIREDGITIFELDKIDAYDKLVTE
ncbi:MAG: ion channel [Chitinophagales bacterium]